MDAGHAFRPCAVVPVYNHAAAVGVVVDTLLDDGLFVFLVDDGSDADCARTLDELAAGRDGVELVRLDRNQGKGAAVLRGAREALARGFSHALQVDADNQHDLATVPEAIDAARQHPRALIAGVPVFDDSAPGSRRYGRWLSHVFVWLNTWSFSIRDCLCGFRVYPLAETVSLANRHAIGPRMEFDIEIAVRLCWDGVPVRSIRVGVRYPPGSVSHFHLWHDNLRISRVHARLFLGMLPRAPLLWSRRLLAILRRP